MSNRHESPRAREIADNGLILLSQVGSGLHGVTVNGQDDRDEMGVCIEPPSCVIGLERFEQYQFRTQPEGKRSGPGDLDKVVYSLRKWTRLAAAGNPTVLLLLFAPPDEIVYCDPFGRQVQQAQDLLISRECGRKFIGYLNAQREQMLGLRSKHTNRPELVAIHGFDTKFAYHAIRLGIQGVELLDTGRITLPIPEPHRTWLRDLRLGKHSREEALAEIDRQRAKLETLVTTVDLPDNPDPLKVNNWLTTMYSEYWELEPSPG